MSNIKLEAMEKKLKIILERARGGVEPIEILEKELLDLYNVSNRREMLISYEKNSNPESYSTFKHHTEKGIDEFLSNL